MVSKSDFSNIKDSGKACCGCGVTGDRTPLTKLATYALAFACWPCFKKHWNCGGCQHSPHPNGKACKTCGCKEYQHGLAAEFDRQYGACVGLPPRLKECQSYGQNIGKCGKTIFVDSNGQFPRLCADCDRRWSQEVGEGLQDIKKKFAILDALQDTENPGGVLH